MRSEIAILEGQRQSISGRDAGSRAHDGARGVFDDGKAAIECRLIGECLQQFRLRGESVAISFYLPLHGWTGASSDIDQLLAFTTSIHAQRLWPKARLGPGKLDAF